MNLDDLILWQNSMVDKYRDKIAEEDECLPEDVNYYTLELVKSVGDVKIYKWKNVEGPLMVIKDEQVLFIINEYEDDLILSVEEYQESEEQLLKSLPIV